jgi:hypothetical protein
MYTATGVFSVTGGGTEAYAFLVRAPSDAVVVLHEITLTEAKYANFNELPTNWADEKWFDCIIRRTTGDGTSPSSAVVDPISPGGQAFGGSCYQYTYDGASIGSTILHREGCILPRGFLWLPAPHERIYVSPGQRVGLNVHNGSTGPLCKMRAVFEVIGG